MSDKLCLITGANAGIGKAAAHALAVQGMHIVMLCRSQERGAAAQAEIKAASGNENVDLLLADLSVQDDIRNAAVKFRERYDRLDVLVNNAGGYFQNRRETADGLEYTFALNHLAYFLLTNLLLDILITTAPARIINVSSGAHRRAKLDFDDLQNENGYSGFQVYGQSKLANILFTRELARRLKGTNVTANAMHPGFVASNFGKNNGRLYHLAISVLGKLFGRSPEEGADTIVYLATAPEVADVSGAYFANREQVQPANPARNDETARRLWQVSAELTRLESSPIS